MHTLSKSDFKVGRTCPTKLYYKKKRYPTTWDENPYLKLLAEGGFMVEEIARLLYPNGVEVDHSNGNQNAVLATQRLLDAGHTELFEPTFEYGGMLVRVDIFRIVDQTIELIEVKAKSWDSGLLDRPTLNKKGDRLIAKWVPYIEDVAFQNMVLEQVFPEMTVIPYLMMPDKAKTTSVDLLHKHFELRQETRGTHTRYNVTFNGNPETVRGDHFLTRVNVETEVALVADEVELITNSLLPTIRPELTRVSTPLTCHCYHCEYQTGSDEESGFAECWGELASHGDHIFDLSYGTSVNNAAGPVFDQMIREGRTCLLDIDESQLRTKQGSIGKRNVRQLIQLQNTRSATEWQDDELLREMQRCTYPLYFIDFETSTMAIPYHAGMAPYEQVAFQWSCHSVDFPGAPLRHTEWINTDDAFPNFEFARSLRQQIGDEGTVLIWTHHETKILNAIRSQMITSGVDDPELASWLEDLVTGSRIADMNKWCLAYYFHPLMKGSTSIKYVCDAVWQSDPKVREAFPEYTICQEGKPLSPYKGLPPVVIGDSTLDVSEGTGAMVAYQSMLYGIHRNDPSACDTIREALLRYCKLDTAAMVMIWQHWEGGQGRSSMSS